jgi:hypothetical protein
VKLGILTAAYGRGDLTRRVLSYWAGLSLAGVGVVRLCVVSPDDPDPSPPVAGWSYLEAPNRPLSNKFQAGLRWIMDRAVDAVLVTGSDNLVSTPYLDRAIRAVDSGSDAVGLRELHSYREGETHVARIESMTPGAGRVYSARLIDAVRGRLWNDGANLGLDAEALGRIRSVEHRQHVVRADPIGRCAVVDLAERGSDPPRKLWRIEGNAYVSADGSRRLLLPRVTYIPGRTFFTDYFPEWTHYDDGRLAL